jgi:hypothetical protein
MLILTLLPANAFNHHDDYYKYFPRLFQMLQSGKLGGTPFDYVGIDSLGAHPFLQSFIVAHFPLQYVNGFDAVFCFLLAGMLLNDIGRRAELSWFLRSIAIVAFLFINPQYVNISALYSGSLMILALIYSSLLFNACIVRDDKREILWASISFALIASILLALKHTMAPFAVSYFIVFFMLQILISRHRKSMVLVSGITASAVVLSIAPWVWSVYDKIGTFLQKFIQKINTGLLPRADRDVSPGFTSELKQLFSSQQLFDGGTAIDYSFIVICAMVVAVFAGYLLVRKRDKADAGNLIILMSAGISLPIVYLINGYFARTFYVGIRYTCPLIIAAFPAVMLLFAGKSTFSRPGSTDRKKIKANHLSVLLILCISIGLFMNGWFGRLNQLMEFRSMLSYPINKGYIAYNKYSLSQFAQESVKSMQNKAEEKAIILAWFEYPFLLDYKRNRIFTIGSPSIIPDIGSLTLNDLKDPDMLITYLRNLDIRYVIFGYGETQKAPYGGTFELEQGLKALQRKHHIVYDDGRRMMIDITVVNSPEL